MAATPALLIALTFGFVVYFLLRRWLRLATPPSEADDWGMYMFGGDKPAVLQILKSPSPNDQKQFGVAAIIEWTYGDSGAPDKHTAERMHALEDATRPMREDRTALHVHTLTGAGVREWCYYTADQSKFENEFNRLVASLPRMPLKIICDPDPDWSYWRKMKARTAG
jgi:hypothetical protein